MARLIAGHDPEAAHVESAPQLADELISDMDTILANMESCREALFGVIGPGDITDDKGSLHTLWLILRQLERTDNELMEFHEKLYTALKNPSTD